MELSESTAKKYKVKDIAHLIHPDLIPSEFAKSGTNIMVEGYGVRLKNVEGKEYIDAVSNGMVVCLGYRNQELIEAARSQMFQLHSCTSFNDRASTPEVDFAVKLAETAPLDIKRFMFTNSGSDAIETAIKITRWYWREKGVNKYKVISVENCYHGATYGAQSLSSFPQYTHENFGPFVPGLGRSIPSVYCYRCPYGKTYPGCDIDCAQALDETIVDEGADTVAAFLAEPIQTVAGVLVPPLPYWSKIKEICKKHNVLIINDEVINGIGRTGKLWASEHWDIKPDIMVFSKGVASGYMPLAGVGITDDIFKGMITNNKGFPHAFTFGGHPASCAVGLKNIEILFRDNLIEKAAQTGKYIFSCLNEMQENSPYLGDMRGLGLLIGIELVADKNTKKPFPEEKQIGKKIVKMMKDKGVIVGSFNPNSIVLCPPLIISKDDLHYILASLEQVIDQVCSLQKQ